MMFHIMIKRCLLIAVLSVSTVYAEDLMVERMQSVVDEVSELRKRYEEVTQAYEQCRAKKDKQTSLNAVAQECNDEKSESYIKTLELENSKLKEVHHIAKVQAEKLKTLEQELETSLKEQRRLNTSAEILVEKNHTLLQQLNRLKRSEQKFDSPEMQKLLNENRALKLAVESANERIEGLQKREVTLRKEKTDVKQSRSNVNVEALKEKNQALEMALKQCKALKVKPSHPTKQLKGGCVDDNPFPKLLKKEPKRPAEHQKSTTVANKSGVYRIKGESAVYDGINGKVIAIWEDRRSFTSSYFQDDWVKITGYFVDKRWKKAQKELWVKKENTQNH